MQHITAQSSRTGLPLRFGPPAHRNRYVSQESVVTIPMHKRLLSETFGTFWIAFAGTGAIVMGDVSGVLPHVGVAIVLGWLFSQ